MDTGWHTSLMTTDHAPLRRDYRRPSLRSLGSFRLMTQGMQDNTADIVNMNNMLLPNIS